MGYPKIMGPGHAGSLKKYGNANTSQIQYGNKLQGLPSVTGSKLPHNLIVSRTGGSKEVEPSVASDTHPVCL